MRERRALAVLLIMPLLAGCASAGGRGDAAGSVALRLLTAVEELTPAERHTVVVAWNATRTPYPADVCVPEQAVAEAETPV